MVLLTDSPRSKDSNEGYGAKLCCRGRDDYRRTRKRAVWQQDFRKPNSRLMDKNQPPREIAAWTARSESAGEDGNYSDATQHGFSQAANAQRQHKYRRLPRMGIGLSLT